MDFVYFLGRFHVLVLHLPLGILCVAIVLEILARRPKFAFLQPALSTVWLAGAVTGVAAAVLGYMHAMEPGIEGEGVEAHRIAGTLLAIAACVAWAIRAGAIRIYDRIWIGVSVAIFGLMMVTGHLGGNLTHGEVYLVQYAPKPIRQLAGVQDSGPRPKVTDLAQADAFLDVVAPALQQRCASCHNDSKKSGGFSVTSYENVMKGGKEGPVVAAGDPAKSDLYRRITLDPGHADYMPKDGKTPLTPEQVKAVGWWIAQGAPKTATIATLKLTDEDRPALQQVLGLGGGGGGGGDAGGATEGGAQSGAASGGPDALPTVPKGDPQAIAALEANGFVVRPVAADSALLDVNLYATRSVTDADIANLAKLRQQIRTLTLRNAGLTDAQLRGLGAMDNVVRLRLEQNPITDAGLQALGAMKNLRQLNLYGAKITDGGLAALTGLTKLERLHAWETGVTDAGAARLKASHPNLTVTLKAAPVTAPKVAAGPPSSQG